MWQTGGYKEASAGVRIFSWVSNSNVFAQQIIFHSLKMHLNLSSGKTTMSHYIFYANPVQKLC